MKKLLIQLIITAITLAPTTVLAMGSSVLIAQVTLNPELQPKYATTFQISSDQSSAGLANYILQIIAGSLIYVAGPLGVLMIAVGGFLYVNARGDQTKLEEAKKTIIWAVVGLAAIMISYALVKTVIDTLLITKG